MNILGPNPISSPGFLKPSINLDPYGEGGFIKKVIKGIFVIGGETIQSSKGVPRKPTLGMTIKEILKKRGAHL